MALREPSHIVNRITPVSPQEHTAAADAQPSRANSRHWRSPSPPGNIAAQSWTGCAAFFCLLGAALIPRPSAGIGTAEIAIGEVAGAGWSARGIRIELTLTGNEGPAARITAERVKLADTFAALEQVAIACRNPRLQGAQWRCTNARVSGVLGPLGRQDLRADIAYSRATGALSLDVRGLKVAGGSFAARAHWRTAGWEVAVEGRAAQLAELRKLMTPWFALPRGYSLEGKASLQATLRGAATLHSAEGRATIDALTANNEQGSLATDKLGLELTAQLTPSPQGWVVAAAVNSSAGQAYVDPIFVDLAKNPLQATVRATLYEESGTLYLDPLRIDQKNLVSVSIAGRVGLKGPPYAQQLQVALETLQFPDAYAVLMQPFLLDTDFKDLATSGRMSGSIAVAADAPSALDLQVDNITAKDKAGIVGIEGLAGRLVWSSRAAPNRVPSQLTWRAANAYGLSGSGTQLDFLVSGADFRLLQPAYVPVLDGGLFIRTLSAQDVGAPKMSLRFEGEVQPIGMPRLCKAFGWPEFSGTLSGRIPQVSYDDGVLSVGGALEASAFNGQLRVDNLELRNPLGKYPRLSADVALRGLDLEAVTGTFSFGTITGRLDGRIDGLQLFRWTPVKMDLRLYTPEDDDSRHLISQRAVKNLSSIGGGGGSVAAALQGGFLRFFENFHYSTLGLSCRLENEVCHMDGVGRAKGDAYYIVKGSGLPRIDIIGNTRRVDWPRLVEQLKSIEESGGPVIR